MMPAEQIQKMESYLNSPDKKIGSFSRVLFFRLYKSELFQDIETPYNLFVNFAGLLESHPDNPVFVFETIKDEMDRQKLNYEQRLFFLSSLIEYDKLILYEEERDITLVFLFRTLYKKLKAERTQPPKTPEEVIHNIIESELKEIPKLVKHLNSKDRINMFLKLTEFTTPKESPTHE